MDNLKIFATIAQAYTMLTNKQPSQQELEQVLLILGDDGIQQCVEVVELGPEAVAKVMQNVIKEKQAQRAKFGAKLRRISYLRKNF